MPAFSRAWYAFVCWLVRETFFRGVGGLKSVTPQNFPKEGGVIVAPLHVSHADPPAVACASPRHLRFMAKEELFKGIFGRLIASVGAYPLRRGENDTEAIRKTMAMLEAGEAVLVFPEGTRGDGEAIQPIERGVAMLAKRTGAWVLPVGIVGTHKVLPRGASKPRRHRVAVAFGQPFRYGEIAPDASERERREAFAAELQRRIVELCRANGLELKISTSSADRSKSPAAGTEP